DNSRVTWKGPLEPSRLKLIEPKKISELKMAVIFDKFTMESFRYECELLTVHPDDWKEQLTANRPDLLMVESAWEGNNGSWNKRVGDYGKKMLEPLRELIAWCKGKNIPTIF